VGMGCLLSLARPFPAQLDRSTAWHTFRAPLRLGAMPADRMEVIVLHRGRSGPADQAVVDCPQRSLKTGPRPSGGATPAHLKRVD